MSFSCYPKYKDSGVEWLGAVPAHWSAGRFTRVIQAIKDGTHGTFERVPFGKPLLSAKNVQDGYIHQSDAESQISESDHLSIISNGFPAQGDLLLTIVGTIGRSCVYEFDYPLAFQRSVCFIRLCSGNSAQFFFYFTQSKFFQEQLVSRSKSAAQGGIYMGDVVATSLAYPPLDEQAHISAFLDGETAKIDALIAEQKRLIELLKEKRQAVISHAVTKGLDPNAPMKPSSIESLGEVPAHWPIVAIKRFSTLQRGYDLTDAERTDGPYPVVTSGGISGSHGSFMAPCPGVVTGRYGSTGRLFYVEDDFWPHNTSLYVSHFHGNHSRFVWYSLQTVDFAAHCAKAAVPGIDRNDIHVLPVAVPPIDEQLAIVEYLDAGTAKLDTLTAEAQRAIDLLQERRTTLISAAVTGQIDVRDFAVV